MKHRWTAAGSAAMAEDQALEWAGYEGTGVTKTGLELTTTDLFCAVCDRQMGDAPDECTGPEHPSLFPHRWRVMTTMMLTEEEAEALHLDRPDALGYALPQALNVYCTLCGSEFDPAELNCPERAQILGATSRISDEDLERLLSGTFEEQTFDWESIQQIGHDTWMALGDAGFPRDAAEEMLGRLDLDRLNAAQTLPFFCAITEADGHVPVEVSRDPNSGEVTAARVCWTNDVDEVTGNWETVGQIGLNGRCRAWDPRHPDYEAHEFAMRAGEYACQVFTCESDVLGMRLIPIPSSSTS